MAAFYRQHGRVVLAQVLLTTGERVLAEEIVQDTMLAVWRGRQRSGASRRRVPG
jgi:DNA-directed RNA polymerase specialized sigma24 family protein